MKHKQSTELVREKKTLNKMLSIYCHGVHKESAICPSCSALAVYAEQRIDKCRYGMEKPSCSTCKTHCFAGDKRNRIRIVMRYAGPRMLLYDPLAALQHMLRRNQK